MLIFILMAVQKSCKSRKCDLFHLTLSLAVCVSVFACACVYMPKCIFMCALYIGLHFYPCVCVFV